MSINPVPKPTRRPKAPRDLVRKTALAKSNPERRAERFETQYGGSEYVEYLHSLGCAICGVTGWTEAAHTETGGMGMKAPANTLVPLCGDRTGTTGCHRLLGEQPWKLPAGTLYRMRSLARKLHADWTTRRVEP